MHGLLNEGGCATRGEVETSKGGIGEAWKCSVVGRIASEGTASWHRDFWSGGWTCTLLSGSVAAQILSSQ